MRRLIAALALLASCLQPAFADVPTWSTGPSVAFARFGFDGKPGSSDPSLTVLHGGAGWTLRYNTSIRSKDGQTAYVSIDGTALADLATLPTSGGLSLSAGPSFLNGLFGVQTGVKLFEVADGQPTEGLFTLTGGRREVFFLLALSVNFVLSMPAEEHVGMTAQPPAQLPANYFRPW